MPPTKPRKRTRAANVALERPEDLPAVVPKRHIEQPLEALRRYITRYELRTRTPMTYQGFLTHGKVGKYTVSGRRENRSTYSEASFAVNHHLRAGIIKEGEAIAEFMYAVQHRDDEFKLQFGPSEQHQMEAREREP